jgi:hypothetical protein
LLIPFFVFNRKKKLYYKYHQSISKIFISSGGLS